MTALDMRTVMFANIIINAVCLVVILQLWYQNRSKYAGLSFWVADWALQLGGALLIALRGTVPNWASMVLSNSMIVGGTLLLYFGLRRFTGKKNKTLTIYAILAIFAIFIFVHSYFLYVHNELIVRSINVSIGLSLACFMGMWLMFRGVGQEMRRIARGTGISFALIILVSLVRIIGFVLLPNTSNDYMKSGMFDTLMVALLSGAIMLLVFNLVLMVNRRIYMESKQMEDELRETSDYLNNLLDYANAPIIVWDAQFRITRFNHAFERLTGQLAGEVTGKKLDILLPAESHDVSMNYIKNTMGGEHWDAVEIPIKNKDGSERTVLWNSASLYSSDSKTLLVTIAQGQDITERKQIEQRLQQASEEWQKTFDSITNLVSIQDKNCRLVMVNKAYADVFKKTPQELIGGLCFELVHGTSKCIQNCPHQQTMQTGKPAKEEFFEPNLGLYLEVNTSPICNTDGAVTGSVHIVQNISERKQAEEKIKLAQETLSIINNKLEERNRQNSLLGEMRELLQSCSTVQEVAPIVISSVAKLFPGTDGALFLLNNSQTDLQSVARWGDFPEDVDNNIFATDACWGLRLGRVYAIENMKIGPICPHLKQPSATAYICLPLIAKGEILGLLHLGTKRSGQGDSKQGNLAELKEIAVMFAEYLSLSIANIKLLEKLASQSIRDTLTGLYNRRYMEETIQREILRAARKQTQIGIVMADIDHFKQINDTYGHEAGDEFLIKLAEFFKLKTRGSDVACRYGGEEFILVLPESSVEDTYKRAEYLRQEVKHIEVVFRGQLLPAITLSFGIATYPDHGTEMNGLLRIADVALYKAKADGRDRVIIG